MIMNEGINRFMIEEEFTEVIILNEGQWIDQYNIIFYVVLQGRL